MPVPANGLTIYDPEGNRKTPEEVIDEIGNTPERILVDDELGISVDLAGLGYQTESMDWRTGRLNRAEISVLHKRKRQARILRITTSAGTALDVAEDTLIHVRDSHGHIRHVRADKLKPGMSILSVMKDDGTPGFVVY